MVALSTVVDFNASFAEEDHAGSVCVFAGATAGIGLATLKRMATMLHSSSFYILGRSLPKFQHHIDDLKSVGPSNRYIFIEAQVSLISSIDAACTRIAAVESKVDYLLMSPGGVPWSGPVYTSEGLETCFAVSYYSRMRLVSNLLPLFHNSPHPRVLSVLNGGREKAINTEDIGLEKSWGVFPVINHTTTLHSLAFDYLAANDSQKHIVFLHAFPGLVNSSPKQKPDRKNGLVQWLLLWLLKFVMRFVYRFKGTSLEESGERHAFRLTADTSGAGSWRVNQYCDLVSDNLTLARYRSEGWEDKVWEHTQRVWDKALGA
ncbi:hypothetical protein BDV96DRAFT_650565 [Lophiotrema nucula]|uniref:Short-chain dehydrogenases/reductase n=1 Tax=Lophiotrema nucula TaxID=690887 RepID=A0A6A5YXW5_9PLEO|nr:hypothetical protein BDV96DRAFT_650565 [Lophiotrema nucula]